jgi:hypothetical protein
MLPDLLHGEERKVWGDGGYQGQGEAIRQAAPRAQDMTSRRVQFKNCFCQLDLAPFDRLIWPHPNLSC